MFFPLPSLVNFFGIMPKTNGVFLNSTLEKLKKWVTIFCGSVGFTFIREGLCLGGYKRKKSNISLTFL
jgi:hypothetical protein